MLIRRILEFGCSRHTFLAPTTLFAHTSTCPTVKKRKECPGSGGLKRKREVVIPRIPSRATCGKGRGGGLLVRRLQSGKCRFGFIPEEWFLFFRPMTGVSGPYIFMIVLGNYLVSKEIYVMEHEYYLGLSALLVLYLITTKFGAKIAAILDKHVDAIANKLEQDRENQIKECQIIIKEAGLAQLRAEAQQLLMKAKKENIEMQLEAAYRERLMKVYQKVKDRMEYHVKRRRIETRIHQKWMVQWILKNVQASITPEFKKSALESAIRDLAALSNRAK